MNKHSKLVFKEYNDLVFCYKKCPICQSQAYISYAGKSYTSAFCKFCRTAYQLWFQPIMPPHSIPESVDIIITIQLSNYIIKFLYSKYINLIKVYEEGPGLYNFYSSQSPEALFEISLHSIDEFVTYAKDIVSLKSKIEKLLVLK